MVKKKIKYIREEGFSKKSINQRTWNSISDIGQALLLGYSYAHTHTRARIAQPHDGSRATGGWFLAFAADIALFFSLPRGSCCVCVCTCVCVCLRTLIIIVIVISATRRIYIRPTVVSLSRRRRILIRIHIKFMIRAQITRGRFRAGPLL